MKTSYIPVDIGNTENMKTFLRRNARLILTVLLALTAGAAIGLVAGHGRSQKADESVKAQETVRIGSHTAMERIVHFEACSHEESLRMETAAYLGYTRDELSAHFPDASIIVFNSDQVRIMQVRSGYCPRHYVLRLRDDGSLGVLRTDDSFLTEELVTLIRGETIQIQPNERENLQSGLAFDSLEEIDTYLESMGS